MRFPPWAVASSLLACAPTPPKSPVDQKVRLSEQAPPVGYVQVRALSIQSGKGCGLLAERGSREDADQKLRIAADKLGATYVQVTGRREPGPNHLCLEHEYHVSGVAYRAPGFPALSSAAPPSSAAPVPSSAASATVPTLPHALLNFDSDATVGKPARSTDRTSVALSLAPGDGAGTALSVSHRCQGSEPQALLAVWFDLGRIDFRSAKALSLRVKPDAALTLSVSFMDGNRTSWTQQPAPLTPGVWQTVTLELYKFWHNPYGPPGDKPSAPMDLTAVSAFGIAPKDCADGHYLLDDVRLE
ncbi:MAG: hypothetical protein K0R38_408 [Polyangiaceae bacterium]|jgi:hypothetical protein|nr:hypothetical protein [Polyangiaceae bacterium]